MCPKGKCAGTSRFTVSMITSVIMPPVHARQIPSRKTSLLRTHAAPVRSGTNGSRKTAPITRIDPVLHMHSLFTMSKPSRGRLGFAQASKAAHVTRKGSRRNLSSGTFNQDVVGGE